jgi:hypothetical protein
MVQSGIGDPETTPPSTPSFLGPSPFGQGLLRLAEQRSERGHIPNGLNQGSARVEEAEIESLGRSVKKGTNRRQLKCRLLTIREDRTTCRQRGFL